jgi:hypothetical protein
MEIVLLLTSTPTITTLLSSSTTSTYNINNYHIGEYVSYATHVAGSHKNLAVYWGANSVGPNAPEESWQGPLVEYCKAPEVDVCVPRHQYDHY